MAIAVVPLAPVESELSNSCSVQPAHVGLQVGAVQLPPTQFVPVSQELSQVPQWEGLVVRSTQVPPQSDNPLAQTQDPSEQASSWAQAFPQVPQFWASVEVSMHEPSQRSVPAGQVQVGASPEVAAFWHAALLAHPLLLLRHSSMSGQSVPSPFVSE